MSVPLKNLRITPREGEFLDRKTGLIGEIFYDKDADTLRLYNGSTSGIPLARADLQNISNAVFAAKATAAGVGSGGGGGNTTVSVGATIPTSPSNGNLWLNTNNGILYVYINDGDSNQWIQPAVPLPDTSNFATLEQVKFQIAADDSTQIEINSGDTIQFIGGTGINTSSNADGVITIDNSLQFVGTSGITVSTNGDVITISGVPQTPDFELYVAGDDSTQRRINNGNLIKFVGAGGVTTTSDADGVITITGGGTTGNITFSGNIIDSADSSAITITPTTNFNSDLVVENDLTVNNLVTAQRIVAASIETDSPGVPEIFSETNLNLTAVNTINLTASKINAYGFGLFSENISLKSGATGIVAHNLNDSSIFYHSSPAADFTVNFTNVPTTNQQGLNVLLIIDQGGTARIPLAAQIDGAATTIQWLGAGGAPSGNNNQIDLFSFSLIRVNSAWTVLASLATYG